MNVNPVEPRLCSPGAPTVLVGRNHRGNWVAREQSGMAACS